MSDAEREHAAGDAWRSLPRYAYLGPPGTFTEVALRGLPDTEHATLVPYASVPAAFDAVRRTDCVAAMVALENSVEGVVPATVDELATGAPLVIIREVLLPVSFALLVREGTRLEDVKTVAS